MEIRSSGITYRPEIDGLRAVAVVPVILFHAGFNLFSGGFIGVDMFFVISGYLITAIILSEIKAGSFSLAKFYERRARRILPALFFVIVLCLPFAWFWMTPQQVKMFLQSVFATAVFASNFFFAYTSGYFDAAAEEKPLLHTWSLGVEEQFYLIFPLFFSFFYKFGSRRLGWIVLCLAVLSFGLSEVVSRFGSSVNNFFLTPTRAWELLLGSLIVLASREGSIDRKISILVNDLASCAGLTLILLSVITYDKTTPFPSFYTLAPTIGTVLILVFGTKQTLVAKLLSSRCMVMVGLISYSAYLWHQPLFAFIRIYSINTPSELLFVFASVVTMALAYLTWRFIEQPFRDKRFISQRIIFVSAVVGTFAIASVGLAGHLTKGFEAVYMSRLTMEQSDIFKRLESAISTGGYAAMFDNQDCKFWDKTITKAFQVRYGQCAGKYGKAVVVLGDSHAMDLYNSLAINSMTPFIVGIAQGGCRPHNPLRECHYEDVAKFIREQRDTVKVVFYTQSGGHFITANARKPYSDAFARLVHDYLFVLSEIIPVVWLGPHAELAEDMRSVNPIRGKYSVNFKNEIDGVDEFLSDYNVRHRVKDLTYLSMLKLTQFTPNDLYYDGAFTYSDSDHWSSHGEKLFGSRLVNQKVIGEHIEN